MRKLFLGVLFFVALAAPALAQRTVVSGTVTDVNGLPYAGGTLQATLSLPVGASGATLNGVQIGGTTQRVTLDSTGSFLMQLPDNNVVLPGGTQWTFNVNISPGAPLPLGNGPQSCSATLTITGASQSISSNLSTCPALARNGAGGSAGTAGVYLSQNCSGSVAPCTKIPPGGGCFQGAITNNGTGVITFVSGFPNPAPIVGQQAWVTIEHGNGGNGQATQCGTNGKANFPTWFESNVIGSTASGPVTITAVNPGVSVTVSTTVSTTQNGFNAMLFYGPNIYSQMRIACPTGTGANGSGANIHIDSGYYVLDNTGSGTQSACGCQQSSGCATTYFFGSMQGAGKNTTTLMTPPWYNHGGDLGTVLAGGPLQQITLTGDWTNLNVGIGRGTPYLASPDCGSFDFSIRGYNFGTGAAAETMYPVGGTGQNEQVGDCEIKNAYITTGNRGTTGISGRMHLLDSVMLCQSSCTLAYGGPGNNGVLNIEGGFYESAGGSPTTGAIQLPEAAQTASGDVVTMVNSEVCMDGSQQAINDQEASGEIRLVNTKINAPGRCTPGTNASGVVMASGITLRATQSVINANGTGNTINNPAGATFVDNCGNTLSGGAGYAGGGSLFGSCSITGTLQTAGNFADGAGLGTSTFGTVTGDSRHGQVTVTFAGALTTTPQFTMTFPTPFLVAPTCTLQDVGGNNAFPTSISNGAISTTSAVFNLTFAVAPTAGNTDTFVWNCSN